MWEIGRGEAEVVVSFGHFSGFFFLFSFFLFLVISFESDYNAEESGGIANGYSTDDFFIVFDVGTFPLRRHLWGEDDRYSTFGPAARLFVRSVVDEVVVVY